jgi:hypothetical protein
MPSVESDPFALWNIPSTSHTTQGLNGIGYHHPYHHQPIWLQISTWYSCKGHSPLPNWRQSQSPMQCQDSRYHNYQNSKYGVSNTWSVTPWNKDQATVIFPHHVQSCPRERSTKKAMRFLLKTGRENSAQLSQGLLAILSSPWTDTYTEDSLLRGSEGCMWLGSGSSPWGSFQLMVIHRSQGTR